MGSASFQNLQNLLLRGSELGMNSKNLSFREEHVDRMLRMVRRSCQDENAINDALELIPIAELVQDNQEILDDPDSYHDNLLPLITQWFANEFFSWFKPPPCVSCSGEMVFTNCTSNPEGKSVEHYRCKRGDCVNHTFDFIRHREPAILLRTRTGRCGEWANCFMTFLLSLKYHVRMVFDSTDHVWNEVWSESQRRWIHVDPCECAIDKPLLYELGWSKKLQYCLAFGQYEVLDVTPRYCLDFTATKTIRNQVDEDWLREQLDQISSELLLSVTDTKLRQTIEERREIDKTFLRAIASKPQTVSNSSSLGGRKTGDLNWRIQRGEASPLVQNKCSIDVNRDCQILNKETETMQPLFSLSYNCDKNRYESTKVDYRIKGWSSLTHEYENIDFKYERDWKTSYLARYESCPPDREGRITWRFNLAGLFELDHQPELQDYPWTRLEILAKGKEYPNTCLNLIMDCRDVNCEKVHTVNLDLNVLNSVSAESLPAETRIIDLTASLSGGCQDDSVAWQKPQLFRQTRGQESHLPSFVFNVF